LSREPAVLLDLDGTLVDSVYSHVICWHEALRESGYEVPMWRIHASIGMGSDRMLPWLLGGAPDEADAIADSHTRRFLERAGDLLPTNGARRLIDDLEEREVPFIIATSAGEEERDALLDALGRPDLETTDAADVPSSKPAPHLITSSADEVEARPGSATLVGDSPWDAEAARRVGMRTIAVRCGGFGDSALRDAGAIDVVDDPRALIGRL
jgi:phosphoglycolate phosphatase-like HAD superfamily hydrolase